MAAVHERASRPPLLDQLCAREVRQMERQGRIGDTECLGNGARGHTVIAGLNQQAKQCQAMLLRKGAKRLDGSG